MTFLADIIILEASITNFIIIKQNCIFINLNGYYSNLMLLLLFDFIVFLLFNNVKIDKKYDDCITKNSNLQPSLHNKSPTKRKRFFFVYFLSNKQLCMTLRDSKYLIYSHLISVCRLYKL